MCDSDISGIPDRAFKHGFQLTVAGGVCCRWMAVGGDCGPLVAARWSPPVGCRPLVAAR